MFKSRKGPKKIGQDGTDDDVPTEPADFVARKPKSSKVKKTSNLHTGEDEEQDEAVSVVKRTGPLRTVGGSSKSKSSRIPSERLPLREIERDIDRPSYSADHLAELKSSTPTKRPSPDRQDANVTASTALDISAKFGAGALVRAEEPSIIPSEAEIREKKDRRRRLAREQDFISLDDGPEGDSLDSDDEHNSRYKSLIHPAEEINIKDKYEETRLVRDDEEFAEGFDEFVDDPGRVTLGKAGAKEQSRQRRMEMDAQIRAAQGGTNGPGEDGDEYEVDEEEAARNAAYDEAQARFGTYGMRSSASRAQEKEREASLQKRLQNVPEMGVVPDWKSVMARFDELMRQKDEAVQISRRRLEEVRREKEEIDEEQTRVQGLLKEAGERFERAQREMAAESRNITPAETQADVAAPIRQDLENESTPSEAAQSPGENIDTLRPAAVSGMAGMAHNNADDDDDDYY